MNYESEVSMYGTDYDYQSITHYSEKAFSKNGEPTIISKEPGGDKIMGQRNQLSEGDIKRLRRMYNCAWSNLLIENKSSSLNLTFISMLFCALF